MHFGTTAQGQDVEKITLQAGDLTVAILTWGAVVQDVRLAGIDRSLTLGSDRIADYEGAMRYHGSLIGPIVNRISTARVKVDGIMYELERNQDGRIHLHSGAEATHLRVWDVAERSDSHVRLTCTLPDGACGLPGHREVSVTYTVTAPADLRVEIDATTDAKTPLSFANHSYWNLDGSAQWNGHRLQVLADRFLPATSDDYPTGEIVEVSGTDMDFRTPRVITAKQDWLDNNFCLSDTRQPLRHALTLTGASGVTLQLDTTEPGVQVYDGRAAKRPDRAPFEGLAIEAQMWPDAPTNRAFPSIMCDPDTPYRQETRFRFS
ncbi:aldose epimerase family protein [Yoonia sp. 208BN28-4]|uniref:aldose epimerase family protein n=1 Tax=Yoonia sp. 208BN28-4 TaxID=3126505 RepID=UPI0030995826